MQHGDLLLGQLRLQVPRGDLGVEELGMVIATDKALVFEYGLMERNRGLDTCDDGLVQGAFESLNRLRPRSAEGGNLRDE